MWTMPDYCEENAPDAAYLIGFVVQVCYPRGHHRFRSSAPKVFGDGRPLPRPVAELLAWSLQRQGAVTALEPVRRQLSLFTL